MTFTVGAVYSSVPMPVIICARRASTLVTYGAIACLRCRGPMVECRHCRQRHYFPLRCPTCRHVHGLAPEQQPRPGGGRLAYRQRHAEAGLCLLCPAPAVAGTLCRRHRAMARARQARYEARLRGAAAVAAMCLLVLWGCGDSSSRQSAQTGPSIVVAACPIEPGGPTDLYQFAGAWPEATGTHGTYCPPRTWPDPPYCMWQSYDLLRGRYVSLYGPECVDCCDWSDVDGCRIWVASPQGCPT